MEELSKKNNRSEKYWHLAIIPLYMALGPSGPLITLFALSLGASLIDIGIISATGSAATILFSTIWGKVSDLSGRRKIYFVFILAVLCFLFLTLGSSTSVAQLILLNALLSVFISGISPIVVMLAIETSKSKSWENHVAKYNSVTNSGAIFGLLLNTAFALFFQINYLFYAAFILCLASAILLWAIAPEPPITLERHAFSPRNFRLLDRYLSPRPLFHYFTVRRFRLSKGSKRLYLTTLQLLFLSCFIHWTGIAAFFVIKIPFMKNLLLSESQILTINAFSHIVATFSFLKIEPYLKNRHKNFISRAIVLRGILILCYTGLALFIINPASYTSVSFVFMLLIDGIWAVGYAMVWLPIFTVTVSKAPTHSKGATQGKLNSSIAIATAVGSSLGGFLAATFGYTMAFTLAAITTVLATLIIFRINMD